MSGAYTEPLACVVCRRRGGRAMRLLSCGVCGVHVECGSRLSLLCSCGERSEISAVDPGRCLRARCTNSVPSPGLCPVCSATVAYSFSRRLEITQRTDTGTSMTLLEKELLHVNLPQGSLSAEVAAAAFERCREHPAVVDVPGFGVEHYFSTLVRELTPEGESFNTFWAVHALPEWDEKYERRFRNFARSSQLVHWIAPDTIRRPSALNLHSREQMLEMLRINGARATAVSEIIVEYREAASDLRQLAESGDVIFLTPDLVCCRLPVQPCPNRSVAKRWAEILGRQTSPPRERRRSRKRRRAAPECP